MDKSCAPTVLTYYPPKRCDAAPSGPTPATWGDNMAEAKDRTTTRPTVSASTGAIALRESSEETLLKAGALQRAIFNSANFSSIATDAKGVI